ncbi:TetR/AcrR family transcriptional regulator [Phytomonospora endophytica]|uniref:AcrR family transcriptional regulator n=1 Tax=Phytomonospora endophytica TaxID=714109 RepID=A0A841FXR9_9ACTN|nr:TetR/AcrR family transcriptional regulator C-terminal domain-containing protein [Phytomonospora endophytica]MBB6036770.1 AcrR family transcriptional regulator [Phytomonospora endophytica]GIG68196.1 TetR family transcriptional regulator [Phytomonospora endophytica]
MQKPTLTAAQIVRTAIEILDAEGLDGLNMRALGKRLNSAPTAMYWHVKNKDNLVRLAVDEVWHEIALPDPGALGWRAAATKLATGLNETLHRHPWLVQAMAGHFLYGEGKSRFDDSLLAAYEAAGLSAEQADQAAAASFMLALGNAVGASANVALARKVNLDGGDPAEVMRESIDEATRIAASFPRLRARLESAGAGYNEAPGDTFAFGLTAFLDGIERRIAARG